MHATLWSRLWAANGLAFLALFAAGILAAGNFPALDASLEELRVYVGAHPSGLRVLSFLHSIAALLLIGFAAHVHQAVAQADSEPRSLALLAFGGAVLGAIALLLSALCFWLLAFDDIADVPALLRSIHRLSVLTGGVGLLTGLALLMGCAGLIIVRTGALPRWLGWSGLIVAAISSAAPVTLLAPRGPWSPGGLLALWTLPVMLWIAATSIVLVRLPRPHAATADPTRPTPARA